jgi:hypothetical protein
LCTHCHAEPRKVRQLDGSPIQSLAAGGSHSLFSLAFPGARIEKGAFDERIAIPANVLETWACGFGQYGQLGDRAYIHLSAPRMVRELRILTPPEVRGTCHFSVGGRRWVALFHHLFTDSWSDRGDEFFRNNVQRKTD